MSDKDMDLMERYIYEVVRRVKKEQRNEIAMELRELISDMAEQEEMEKVLESLGDPAIFARQYRDENRYVISPDYYDNYEWVLKIVIISIIASNVLSSLVQGVTKGIWINEVVSDMIANTIAALAGGFGIVTFIFAAMERYKVKLDWNIQKDWSVHSLGEEKKVEKKVWTPVELGPVPDKRGLISRSDSIFSLVFIVIFSGLLVIAPQLFGAYVFDEGEFVRSIPLFNLEKWNLILPFLLLSFLFAFVDEVVRLTTGCYCKQVMISNCIAGAVQLVLGIVLFKFLPFWNPGFLEAVAEEFGKKTTSKMDLFYYYGTDLFSNIILIIMWFIVLSELGVTIYKTLRYGRDM